MANWVRAAGKHRDLAVVAAFCAIGLIITFAVLTQMPDVATAMAEINLTP